jgi:tagatose 6-phosphate kinase
VILVVCLNPALDITHHVPVVDWAGVNRPRTVEARPGGKGVNVARTLLALGEEVLVTGLAGGANGQALTAGLADLGVPAHLTPIAGETRRTFAVADEARATVALFNEPGPPVLAAEFAEFLFAYKGQLDGCAAVVLSGSLPPGLPADTYATLIRTAGAIRPGLSSEPEHTSHRSNSSHRGNTDHRSNSSHQSNSSHRGNTSRSSHQDHEGHLSLTGNSGHAGVPVILDASGEALRLGVAAGPAVVKPNLAELEDLAGQPLSLAGDGTGRPSIASAAAELRSAGAEAVVVSLGPAGLYADTAAGGWRVVPPPVDAANPTGAGDAVLAGLTRGLVRDEPWPDRLRSAAALGTASALAPVAGEFGWDDYQRVLAGVTLNEMPPARYGSAEDPGHQGNGGAG